MVNMSLSMHTNKKTLTIIEIRHAKNAPAPLDRRGERLGHGQIGLDDLGALGPEAPRRRRVWAPGDGTDPVRMIRVLEEELGHGTTLVADRAKHGDECGHWCPRLWCSEKSRSLTRLRLCM